MLAHPLGHVLGFADVDVTLVVDRVDDGPVLETGVHPLHRRDDVVLERNGLELKAGHIWCFAPSPSPPGTCGRCVRACRRSEERRVGKASRSRWTACASQKKKKRRTKAHT